MSYSLGQTIRNVFRSWYPVESVQLDLSFASGSANTPICRRFSFVLACFAMFCKSKNAPTCIDIPRISSSMDLAKVTLSRRQINAIYHWPLHIELLDYFWNYWNVVFLLGHYRRRNQHETELFFRSFVFADD